MTCILYSQFISLYIKQQFNNNIIIIIIIIVVNIIVSFVAEKIVLPLRVQSTLTLHSIIQIYLVQVSTLKHILIYQPALFGVVLIIQLTCE